MTFINLRRIALGYIKHMLFLDGSAKLFPSSVWYYQQNLETSSPTFSFHHESLNETSQSFKQMLGTGFTATKQRFWNYVYNKWCKQLLFWYFQVSWSYDVFFLCKVLLHNKFIRFKSYWSLNLIFLGVFLKSLMLSFFFFF